MIISLLLAAITFVSPVHNPIEMAGNFGEPRPNHFHGGIDIKTDRGVNKPVYSIAEGYVSGVSVGLHGYGNAVWVRHPNGYTSLYCHLNHFSPRIEAALKRYQYKHKVFACDATFGATEIPVSKGQFIAFSGDTGASQGPHIHLEIHQTSTGNLMDPLNFLGRFVKDHTPPEVLAFKAYPVVGEGSFARKTIEDVYTFSRGAFPAWGKVGFSVYALDHMDGIYNSFGIRHTRLYCDNKLIFESDVSNLPVTDHRMVNSWGDYNHYMRTRRWFMKSFLEPGNRLPFLKTDKNRGYVIIDEKRDYHFRYVISDAFGNTTEKTFTVHGEPHGFAQKPDYNVHDALLTSRDNHLRWDGVELSVPRSLVATNVFLQPKMVNGSEGRGVTFTSGNVPLLGFADVKLKVNGHRKNTSKYYLRSRQPGMPPRYCGGSYSNGWVKGQIRELGHTYEVAYDDKAPTVREKSMSYDHVTFELSDVDSSIGGYEAYIDGRFVLFERRLDGTWNIACDLRKTPVARLGKPRDLKLIVWDNCKNKTVYTTKVDY